MSNPTLPPYLGSWDELVKALLHNPFLGSGGAPHPHLFQSHSEASGPVPDPSMPIANLIVLTAAVKNIAAHLPESQKPIAAALTSAAADWEDGICPPPRPRPHVLVAAVEVLALASTLEQGGLRTALAHEAGTILEKSFASTGERPTALSAIA